MATAPKPDADSEFRLLPDAVKRRRVVFVCIGNACRSQMAEGWLRHQKIEWLEAVSAGLFPLFAIPEETIEVMKEKGVSLDGQRCKGLEAIDWQETDILVNMSGVPTSSLVPVFSGRRESWEIPDPYQESIVEYCRVRDILEKKVAELVRALRKDLSGGGSSVPLPS